MDFVGRSRRGIRGGRRDSIVKSVIGVGLIVVFIFVVD